MLTITLPPPTLSPEQYDFCNDHRKEHRVSWGDVLRAAIDYTRQNPPDDTGTGWQHFASNGKRAPVFLVDIETNSWLDAFCKQHDVTRSGAIRACVENWMNSQKEAAIPTEQNEIEPVTIQE